MIILSTGEFQGWVFGALWGSLWGSLWGFPHRVREDRPVAQDLGRESEAVGVDVGRDDPTEVNVGKQG